jgi:hypothetical protein
MTSPEPLSPAQTLQLHSVRTPATTAIVLLVAVCAANVFATWSSWNSYWVAADYVSGMPGIGVAALVGADNTSAGATWLTLIALVAAAAALLTWVWRARVNAERINAAEHRLSRGWSIGGWICPVVNLWYPRFIMDDIWRTSRPGVPNDLHRVNGLEPSGLVRAWWYTILTNALVTVVARFEAGGPLTVDTLKTVAVYGTISTVIVGVAAVLLIQVIRQITEWQSTPREARSTDWRRA